MNVEKVQERWWECVLTGEEKINVRKIDASRPVTDLGEEEQAKIEEMMYNQNQKRLGLPQSHEQVRCSGGTSILSLVCHFPSSSIDTNKGAISRPKRHFQFNQTRNR